MNNDGRNIENENINYCIECEVVSCKYHSSQDEYCALDKIKVGTHEDHPDEMQCTDCLSFEVKD